MSSEEIKTGKGRKKAKDYNAGMRERTIGLTTEYYLQGYGYRKIAQIIEEETGVKITHTTVGKYVRQSLQEWKDERLKKIDDQKAVELQRIDKLEQTYWQAWEKSLEDVKKTKNKQRAVPKASGEGTEMSVFSADKEIATEERLGDPRYLQGVQWCIQKRCEILGIDAPTQINTNITGNVTTQTVIKTRKRERPMQ